MLGRMLVFAALGLLCLGVWGQEKSPAKAPEKAAETPPDFAAWEGPIRDVRSQLDLLSLFSALTTRNGIKVPVPKEFQRIPLEKFEGMEQLSKKIQIDLKELRFYGLEFQRPQDPQWRTDHPVLPTAMNFDRIQVEADAKTGVGVFPLKGNFRKGVLPLDFDILKTGYEILVTPENRAKEGKIEDIKIETNIPLAGPLLTKLLSDKLGEAILKAGVGQTLKLDKNALLGSAGGGLPLDQLAPLLKDEGAQKLLNNPDVRDTLERLLK